MAYLDGITLEHTIGIYEKTLKIAHSPVDSLTLEFLKELKAYKDAEEQGLLIKLPCKVGDTVWCIFENQVYKGMATTFSYWHCEKGRDYLNIEVEYDIVDPFYSDGRLMKRCDLKRYGKRVFLTKEEAEQKLAEMKGE